MYKRQAEASQMAASSQLPEAQEQALDEYPMPDEQVSLSNFPDFYLKESVKQRNCAICTMQI